MNLEPGARIIYTSPDGTRESGTYIRTGTWAGEIRHWIYFDVEPDNETYVCNFKRITREYTLEHHDLHEIG